MQAHVLLCDHAQVAGNKLFISGAGISNIPVGVSTSLAVLIYVPWDQANTQIPYTLHLETSDGVTDLPSPDGSTARIELGGQIEVGRPPGAIPGIPLEVPVAIGVPPLALNPGRYMWRLTIEGFENELWTAGFNLHGQS